MTGTKMIGGTLQWTRENFSNRAQSNIRGEARRISLRLMPSRSSARRVAIRKTYLAAPAGLRSGSGCGLSGPVRTGPRSLQAVAVQRHGERHVRQRDGQERPALRLPAVEGDKLDVGQGQEHPVGGIEVIGEAAAIAVAR